MATNNFVDVFRAHPKVKEIYVAGEQPFLDEQQAKNYARGQKCEVETIARPKEADEKVKADVVVEK
jgi:hypothetical protein